MRWVRTEGNGLRGEPRSGGCKRGAWHETLPSIGHVAAGVRQFLGIFPNFTPSYIQQTHQKRARPKLTTPQFRIKSRSGLARIMATDTSHPPSDPPNEYFNANHHPRKRRRRELVPEEPKHADAADVLPEEIVTPLLDRSAATILHSVGFTGFTLSAQERLRQLAEDCTALTTSQNPPPRADPDADDDGRCADYLQMLQTIGEFTRAQRRTKPTVLDFEEMLIQKDIGLAGLEDEMRRVPSKTPTISLPPPNPPPPPDPDLTQLLGPELDGSADQRCRTYDHLPPFPSMHTYRSTPVYPERHTDPRILRERVAAESRLGEVTLGNFLAVSATRKDAALESGGLVSKERKERHEEWKKAFAGLSAEKDAFGVLKQNGHQEIASLSSIMNDPVPGMPSKSKSDDGYLEVIVNADSKFWRKDTRTKKRPRAS